MECWSYGLNLKDVVVVLLCVFSMFCYPVKLVIVFLVIHIFYFFLSLSCTNNEVLLSNRRHFLRSLMLCVFTRGCLKLHMRVHCRQIVDEFISRVHLLCYEIKTISLKFLYIQLKKKRKRVCLHSNNDQRTRELFQGQNLFGLFVCLCYCSCQ